MIQAEETSLRTRGPACAPAVYTSAGCSAGSPAAASWVEEAQPIITAESLNNQKLLLVPRDRLEN